MHITKLSAALLGLVALASAVPHPQSEFRALDRRLKWYPRSVEVINLNSGGSNNKGASKNNGGMNNGKSNNNGGNGNDRESVTIVDTTVVKLNEQSRNSEVELTILVEEKIKIDRSCKRAKDNIRENHYRNKNKNQVSAEILLFLVFTLTWWPNTTRTPSSLSSPKLSTSATRITTIRDTCGTNSAPIMARRMKSLPR